MSRIDNPDHALLRRWVDTWRRAEVELEAIRRAEIESIDTQQAVRHIFEGLDGAIREAGSPASGLVEQQAWFALLRLAGRS